LEHKLDGSEVKIKSLFNPDDHRPSMFIFFSNRLQKWWFHDFSTGRSGDAIKLVMELCVCPFPQACSLIMAAFVKDGAKGDGLVADRLDRRKKFCVSDVEVRDWNAQDAAFWTSFHIDSDLLQAYGVRPLRGYVMTNTLNKDDQFLVEGGFLYGYFRKNGRVYKIYRPKRAECKFITVQNYLQGLEQLEDRVCLLLVSSLKDGLSLRSMQLNVDFVAPGSECSLLSANMLHELMERYEGRVFTLFDNDAVGIEAMKEYRKQYELSPVLLSLEKDVSDSVKKYGLMYVRNRLIPLIDRKFI
jgi:hypothetical protein